MRNRLWNELTQAKHNAEYASIYLDRQKQIANIFNITILVFSTSGILGWKVWDRFPVIACAIVSGLSLLKLIQPHLIMSEKQLLKLDRIHIFYCDHFIKLEKLWHDLEDEDYSEKEVKEELYQVLESEIPISKELNGILLKKPKRLVRKAKQVSDDYFERVFNVKS
jgi:hypothetical protein